LFNHLLYLIVLCFYIFNKKNENGSLYFFTHDGILEHEPIELINPIRQYLADEKYLWAIDSITQTIFYHVQPLFTHEISSMISKHDDFISFNNQKILFHFVLQ